MSMTPLATPPSRSDPANFAARADTLFGALPNFVTEANALQDDIEARQADVTAKQDSVLTATTAAFAAGLANAATNAATANTKAIEAAASASDAQAAWTAALAANPDLNPAIRMNPSTIATDTTVPSGYNAYSAGPLTIAESTTVTIQDHAQWSII
jgi:hypothetical protein